MQENSVAICKKLPANKKAPAKPGPRSALSARLMESEQSLLDEAACKGRHVGLGRPNDQAAKVVVEGEPHQAAVLLKVQIAGSSFEYVVAFVQQRPPLSWVAG